MPRPSNQIKIPFKADAACPCGSGQRYDVCHGREGVIPVSTLGSLLPPGPVTGHSHEKCFMASTANCSPKISREHYISKAILQQLPILQQTGGFLVLGLPGNRNEPKTIGMSSMTAKILCERHNNALSPLDTAAGLAFGNISRAMAHVMSSVPNRKRERSFLVDGYAIELWAVKFLSGLHFAGIASADGTATRDVLAYDLTSAAKYLSGNEVPWPVGFYYFSQWHPSDGVAFQPVVKNNHLGMVVVGLQHFGFTCAVSIPEGSVEFKGWKNRYRPSIVAILAENATSFLHFAWSGLKVGDTMRVTYWPPRPLRGAPPW